MCEHRWEILKPMLEQRTSTSNLSNRKLDSFHGRTEVPVLCFRE